MQRRRVQFGRAVRVSWYDSAAYDGWKYNPKTTGEVGRIQTLGYVVDNNSHSLVMTSSIGNQGAVLAPLHIPWGAIAHLEMLPTEFSR